MKLLKKSCCRFVIFCIVLLLHPLTARGEDVLLRADPWYPFNGDPKSDSPGFIVELAEKIFKPEGFRVDYSIMPWSRSIKEAESGTIDGIIGAAKGDAPTFVFPKTPMAKVGYTFFSRPDNQWSYSGESSLNKVRIACISSYSYGPTFDSYAEKNSNSGNIQRISGDNALEKSIRMLQSGRVDVIVSVPEVFYTTIKDLKIDKGTFKEVGNLPDMDEIFIAFSPNKKSSSRYAQILDSGMKKLRESGEFQGLLDKYAIKDWEVK